MNLISLLITLAFVAGLFAGGMEGMKGFLIALVFLILAAVVGIEWIVPYLPKSP